MAPRARRHARAALTGGDPASAVEALARFRELYPDHEPTWAVSGAAWLALGDLVHLMPTPGHTPHHVAVAFGRNGADGVITGDLIHSPLQARYPELSVTFDVDKAQAAATRRGFLARYCDTDTLCCGTHFPSPSWGRITRWGDGFRCEPLAD